MSNIMQERQESDKKPYKTANRLSEKSQMEVRGRICTVFADSAPEYVLIQPTGTHEAASLDSVAARIHKNTGRRFCFVSFPIADWNQELSPWRAKQAFGDAAFGDGAGCTLRDISEALIPTLHRQLSIPAHIPHILGGYSLAGLFSLWCAYETDIFDAVAACSPSVWIAGWREYTAQRRPLVRRAYISLGTKEHKTRNPMLQTVKQAVAEQYEQMRQCGVNTVLEWNHGTHFQDYAERMGKAFLWAVNTDEESGEKHENHKSCSGGNL